MGTRSAAFTGKIHTLSEFHHRLVQGTVPTPSGVDIANLLKYFNQLLLGVLRDIKSSPVLMLRDCNHDETRLALLPNLDYCGLLKGVTNLLDLLHLVTFGKHALGTAILQLLSTLMIFLDRDTVDTLPFFIASMIANTPETVHPFLLKTLCFHVLPASVGASPKTNEEEDYSQASVPAVIMLVLQYTENSAYHCQLIECLMSVKCNVIEDLMCVIAYGTPGSRIPAANILFYYWPNLNPKLFDRKGITIKLADISCVLKAMFNKPAQAAKADSVSHTAANTETAESKAPKGWKALPCQNDNCTAERTKPMAVACLDHVASLGACPEAAPPLYMCLKCKEELLKAQGEVELNDILMPMTSVSTSCENKNCRSTEKNAIATCFSLECCSYNNNRPVRYCSQCNVIRHSSKRGTADHKVHTAIASVWEQSPQMLNFLIECIVSLLSEAQPSSDKSKTKESERANRAPILEETDQGSSSSVEDGRVLSRYGVWLVVGLCTPTSNTPIPILGRLLGALCHWFTATHSMSDDQQGVTIERLKSDHLQGWLQEVCKTHMDVFVDCLLPYPSEYCRVGGHWETLSPRSEHIQEGFRRLFCLVPYEVITVAVWERVMPNWLEAIHRDVPEDQLHTMKITLSKLLDNEMSPLGFDATQLYNFLVVRFENTSANVQEQNLEWLQMLSSLNINVPIYLLLSMFETGVSSFLDTEKPDKKTSTASEKDDDSSIEEKPELEPVSASGASSSSDISDDERDDDRKSTDDPAGHSDPELVLTCYVLMLDIAFKQMEVQDITKHQGISSGLSTAMWQLLNKMLKTPCLISHSCEAECNMCYLINTFFQLCTEILTHLCPKIPIGNARVADIIKCNMEAEIERSKAAAQALQAQDTSKIPSAPVTTVPTLPTTVPPAASTAMSFMAAISAMPQLVTATVGTVGDLDLVANIPQEQVMEAMATTSTCTEDELDNDKASAKATVATASVVGADDEPVDTTLPLEIEDDVWITSQGKFKFKLTDLPPQLQVIYALLQRLSFISDGDEVYHICLCLKYLVLHGEALAQTAHLHKGYILWCQENATISTPWSLISGEWSHVAEVCVALLLHCIALPDGADIFWKLCENNFNHSDWKVRFQAVERVVMIGRFLNIASVRQCRPLQAAVSHAFCYLVASLDDLDVAVAQKAALGLTSLPDHGLRALCWCLEQQFDWVILDRPMVIQTMHQLSSCMPDRRILTWDFFYNRFDALYLECQVTLENRGDFFQKPRDLPNSNLNSETYTRKYSRAQEALNLVQSTSAKTLCSSMGPKCPYKRTMSAPANMLNKVDKTAVEMPMIEPAVTVKQSEKRYSRQYSVPLLKHRTSKYGLAGIEGGGFISGGLSGLAGGAAARDGGNDAIMQRLQKVMDLEETDRDTLHLLIFLFMQFLAQPQHAAGNDEKKNDTVTSHVAGLMGYSIHESSFSIPPSKLRASPVFNAFLANLSQVLDQNFLMAKKILSIIVPVLQYCPATHRVPELRTPTYSLWMLQPTVRKAWLTSVLTIFYKFDCDEDYLKGHVQSLILITLNTLDRHFHRCRLDHTAALAASTLHYSRDMSQGSFGGEEDGGEGGGDRSSLATGPTQGDFTPPLPTTVSRTAIVIQGTTGLELQVVQPLQPDVDPSSVPAAAGEATMGKEIGSNKICAAYPDESAYTEIDSTKEVWYDASSSEMPQVTAQPPTASVSPTADAVRAVEVEAEWHLEQTTAVTSVMASQIVAFDDSFTVKIHNTELADGDDSGLQRLSEKALEGLRSRFAASAAGLQQEPSRQSLSPSNTASSASTPSGGATHQQPPVEQDNSGLLSKDALSRRIQSHSQFSSSTPKSSGSSQRSSTSYWLSSSTSTDSSSDFNVSRAATKLAFEICIEEDPESWAATEESKNNNIDKNGQHDYTAQGEKSDDNECRATKETGYYSEESGIEGTGFSSTETNDATIETALRVDQIQPTDVIVYSAKNELAKTYSLYEVKYGAAHKATNGVHDPSKSTTSRMTGVISAFPRTQNKKSDKDNSVTSPNLHSLSPTPKSSETVQNDSSKRSPKGSAVGTSTTLPSTVTVSPHRVHSTRACSPPSPLSMMDLITVGSPVAIDCSTSSPSIDLPSPKLELPTPERLLDGGEASVVDTVDEQRSILERVWQALGSWSNGKREQNGNSNENNVLLQEVLTDGEVNEGSSRRRAQLKDTAIPAGNGTKILTCDSLLLTSLNNNVSAVDGRVYDSVTASPETKHDNRAIKIQVMQSDPNRVSSNNDEEVADFRGKNVGIALQENADKNGTSRDGSKNSDADSSSIGPPPLSLKQSSLRIGEECMTHRCLECGEAIEEFSNEDLGMCIIILSTFVHRKPSLAAPLLPRMLQTVARVAGSELFSWQYTSNVHLPGSSTSIAGQFLRCVLHQLAPYQIFYQIFITRIEKPKRIKLFRTLALALLDFNELNSSAPIQSLLQNLNDRKELPADTITVIIDNLASYMECIYQEGVTSFSPSLLPYFETFLRKLVLCFNIVEDVDPLLRLICAFFKIPGISAQKNINDPVSKAVVFGLRKCPVKYNHVAEICVMYSRCFPRERDRMYVARLLASELLQALKFKVILPDTNLVLLVELILQDNGGGLGPNPVLEASGSCPDAYGLHNNTLVAEAVRANCNEIIDFIVDVHTLTKIKSGLNQDTIGGLLKAGLSQYLALEISRGSSRDSRFFNKYLPWLNSPPTTVQQGPKEFMDCVSHIRLLSWLLVGSLMHTCHQNKNTNPSACMPVPPDASCHIADHIQVILAGFPEQSKASVINMSSLFLAFILSQVWTVYLEQNAGSPGSDTYNSACALLTDFWAKVTPAILQLVSHSKVETETGQLGEMVSLHFLSLLEALQECGSTMLTRLLPLWSPLLHSPHHAKLPDQLAVRLQACQDAIPLLPSATGAEAGGAVSAVSEVPQLNTSPLTNSTVLPNLFTWLNRLQFKMGQIEIQSSAATQFYSM